MAFPKTLRQAENKKTNSTKKSNNNKNTILQEAPPPPPPKKRDRKKSIYTHASDAHYTLQVGFLFLHFFLSMGAQKPRSDHFFKFIYFEYRLTFF